MLGKKGTATLTNCKDMVPFTRQRVGYTYSKLEDGKTTHSSFTLPLSRLRLMLYTTPSLPCDSQRTDHLQLEASST